MQKKKAIVQIPQELFIVEETSSFVARTVVGKITRVEMEGKKRERCRRLLFVLGTQALKVECCTKGKDERWKCKEAVVEWAARDSLVECVVKRFGHGYYPEAHVEGRW